MKELFGFFLVIISTVPMGYAEGKLIAMNSEYVFGRVFPLVLLYFFAMGLYLLGFLQVPTKIGYVIGIWEIAAVTISVSVALTKHAIKLDREYFFLYAVLILATYVLGWAADRIFSKAGI